MTDAPDGRREHIPFSRWLLLPLSLVLLAVCWDRILLLLRFAVRYTDKDQVVLWTAAHEFLNGRFHEPRFFGQDYNSLVEGLVAVPALAAGVPHHAAVPIATSFLWLAPFLLLSLCAWRGGQRIASVVALALPLFLPLEYAMISSMPRGFVTGIFFAALPAAWASPRMSPGALGFACFLLVFSVSINPNAAVLAFPVGLYLWLGHLRSRAFYAWSIPGLALGGLVHFLSVDFYRRHPANLAFQPNLPGVDLPNAFEISLGTLGRGLSHPQMFFADVAPAVPGGVAILALIFALLLIGLYRRGAMIPFAALASGVAFIVATLAAERIHVGSESVYWPWSRSYLAVPLLLVVGLIWLERAAAPAISGRSRLLATFAVAAVAMTSGLIRMQVLDAAIEESLAVENPAKVHAWTVKDVQQRCYTLSEIAEQHGAGLVVFQRAHKVVAYACEPLLDERFKTLLVRDVVPERRTWRIEEELVEARTSLILYNFSRPQIESARRLGVQVGPLTDVLGVPAIPAQLPDHSDLFDFLVAIDANGAEELRTRARMLE